MCRFKLKPQKEDELGRYLKKPDGIMTNSPEIACEVDNPCPASFRARLDYYTKLVQHSCANQVYAPSTPPYADAEAFAFGGRAVLQGDGLALDHADGVEAVLGAVLELPVQAAKKSPTRAPDD